MRGGDLIRRNIDPCNSRRELPRGHAEQVRIMNKRIQPAVHIELQAPT